MTICFQVAVLGYSLMNLSMISIICACPMFSSVTNGLILFYKISHHCLVV